MTDGIPNRSDDRLWTLLGVVELTYHPALAVALLAAVHVVASPVPVVTLDPVAVAVTGEGVPVTTFFAGIALVDLARDVVGVYASGGGTGGAGSGSRSESGSGAGEQRGSDGGT